MGHMTSSTHRDGSLWCCLWILLVVPGLWGSLKMERVTAQAGSSGQWTQVQLELSNAGASMERGEVQIRTGDVSAGLFSTRFEVAIPPGSRWLRTFPLHLPVGQGEALNERFKRLEVEVTLARGGSIIDREKTYVALLDDLRFDVVHAPKPRTPGLHEIDGDMVHDEAPVIFKDVPIAGQKKRPRLSPEKPGELLDRARLNRTRALLLDRVDLTPLEFSEMFAWIERGGLLVLSPGDHGELPSLLQYRADGVVWQSLGNETLRGRRHLFSSSWTPHQEKDGVVLGARRMIGQGAVVVLNHHLDDLVRGSELRAQNLFRNWFPAPLDLWTQWSNARDQAWFELEQRGGAAVWPKSMVIAYLASLLITAMVLSLFFKERPERRWLVWIGGVLLWSVGGLAAYLLGADTSTRMNIVQINLGNGSTGEIQAEHHGALVSGEKRRFDLRFAKGSFSPEGPSHLDLTLTPGGQVWSRLDLAPGVPRRLKWSSSAQGTPPHLSLAEGLTLEVFGGERPGESWVVLGRRIWRFDGTGVGTWDEGLWIGELAPEEQSWLRALLSSERGFNPEKRAFVVFVHRDDGRDIDLGLPDDVVTERTVVDLWAVEPEVGSLPALPPGCGDLAFLRGQVLSRSHHSFDGLSFQHHGTSTDMIASPPHWAPMLKPTSIALRKALKPVEWKLTTYEDGQEKVQRSTSTTLRLKGATSSTFRMKFQPRLGLGEDDKVLPLLGVQYGAEP